MHLFYTPDIEGKHYTLPKEESKHCVRVLRLEAGSEIFLIDGKGGFHKCRITSPSVSACEVEIIESQLEFGKRPFHLTLAITPTKNIDRVEWALEKCTEIGCDHYQMLLSDHSERKVIKQERLQKVVVSAMKQSLKAYLPEVEELKSFKKIVQECTTIHKFIAHCNPGDKSRVEDIYNVGESVTILIGPEGDFSNDEVQFALNHGFTPITLGDSRLRTETAVVVACHTVNFLNKC